MPCILIERFGPQRPTARVDALAVVLQRLLCRFGLFFGEQNIGVRAERRDRERLISEGYAFARFSLIPCLVHDVLRFVSGALGAGRTERRHETFHRAPIRKLHRSRRALFGVLQSWLPWRRHSSLLAKFQDNLKYNLIDSSIG